MKTKLIFILLAVVLFPPASPTIRLIQLVFLPSSMTSSSSFTLFYLRNL
ncbi:MAG: hypothetical protein R3B47_00045 [Bacteroidia bacterium]